jgi:YVTN family beta-propeller protein
MKYSKDIVFFIVMAIVIPYSTGTAGSIDWSRLVSVDGSIEPETVCFEHPVSWSELPGELQRRGITHQPIPRTGRALQVDEYLCGVPPEADNPTRAMITPDGAYAVTAFFLSDNIGIQNLSTYAWEHVIDVGPIPVDVDITPSGNHALVTCLGGNSVVAVNLSTFAPEYTIPVGNSPVAAAIAPDGSRAVVLNSDDDSVTIIDLSGWIVEQTVSSPAIESGITRTSWNTLGSFLYSFSRVEFLSDSITAVIPSWDVVNFLDVSTGTVEQVGMPSGIAVDPAVSRDGTTLAVGGTNYNTDNDINFIDLTVSPPVYSGGFDFGGWNYNTSGITFNADGSLIAAAHYPSTGGYTYIGFYDTTTYSQVYLTPDDCGSAGDILLSPDGNTLMAAGYKAVFVDVSGPVPVQLGAELAGNIEYMAGSPTGAIAVAGSSMMNEMVAVYDFSLTDYARLDYSRPGINAEADLPKHIAISGDGSIIVSADLTSDTLSIVDGPTGTVLGCVPVQDQPYFSAITTDGTTAMCCNYESYSVSIIDVASQTVVATLPSKRRAGNCAFSPDGTRAYAVSVGLSPVDYVSVYDINGASSSWVTDINLTVNQPIFFINGSWAPNPAVSPNGSTLVIPSADSSKPSAIVIDTNLLAIQAVVDFSPVPGATQPYFAAINPAGDTACLVDGAGNLIYFVNLAGPASSLVHSMSPGQNPFNAIYSDDGAYVYINNKDNRTIAVIDTSTYAIVRSVSMPGAPTHIFKSGSTIFAACDVNGPTNPTINTVSMAGPSSALLSTQEKDYYSFFIVGNESQGFALTNCAGWDRYSFLHDPAGTPIPTSTPTLTPTPTPTPTQTQGDCVNHGDTNLDGVITAGDAQLAFYIVLGLYSPTYQEECAADCNGDGIVTAGDAQMIFLTVLGIGSCVDPL